MNCTDCALHKSALTNCVGGRGSETATIMLVGQGPGKEEDLLGQPFIGKSGKLLDGMLADAGLGEDDLWRTNATRCRPPIIGHSERPPSAAEIDACRKHLRAEIHRVQPKVIVALGDVALHALTKRTGIKSARGKSFPLHADFDYECEVWPTYHPAAVLRRPIMRNVVVADLRRLRDRTLPQVEVDFGFVKPMIGPWAILEESPMALDIETVDAAGNVVDYATQFALAKADRAVLVFDESAITAACGISAAPLITHNGWRFDIPTLRRMGLTVPWGRDTLVMAYLDDETQPLNLEALCVRYLGVRGWKEDRDAPLGSPEFAAYNARDAAYTLRLYDELAQRLGPRIKIADRIILPGYEALLACSERGIWIDGDEVARVDAEVTAQLEETRAVLRRLTGEPHFNPNANAQVAEYLIMHGFELPTTEKSGKPRTDKATIARCIEDIDQYPYIFDQPQHASEFLRTFRRYKEVQKKKSTYVVPYARAAASADHRMHNEYTAWNTEVGRTSARHSNVQNLDRDLKAFLSAPPGAVWAEADYNALHIRLAACVAPESTLIDRYRADPKWDPHQFFADEFARLTGIHISRQVAKSANFSQLYLGQEDTLINYAAQFGIVLSRDLARLVHVTWHRTFPGFLPWYQRTGAELQEKGYVETLTGRRRHFGDIELLNRVGRLAALREAVNFQVLGLEPDVALLGLSECHRAGLPVNYFGHDAVRFEFASEGELAANEELIRRCMVDEPTRILREEFGVTLAVPLEIEIKTNARKEQAA